MQPLILSILLTTCAQPAAPTDVQVASVDGASDSSKPVASNDPADASPLPDATVVDELISRLGSSDFGEREEATRKLVEIGPGAFGALQDAYQATDDHEIRLRVQDVVEFAFFQDRLFGRFGFLGIGLDVVDPQASRHIRPGHTGVLLELVLGETAADRAGLRRDDIIVEIDGKPLAGNLTQDAFSASIREAGPGRPLDLKFDRHGALHSVTAVLGARPLDRYFGLGDVFYRDQIDQTSRQFRRWWRQHFGRPTAPLGSRRPSTGPLKDLPRDEDPPSPDPPVAPGGRP